MSPHGEPVLDVGAGPAYGSDVPRVVELRDVQRKDSLISYRRSYTAEAIIETLASRRFSQRVVFTIEEDALGQRDVSVKLLGDIEYPLLPVLSALKDHVGTLDRSGKLAV